MKALPYVYICREKNSPNFYIGYRHANWKRAEEDFGTHYFTSNEYVQNNFDNFDYEILAEFFDKKDAYEYETQLIKELRSEHLINDFKNRNKKPYQKFIVDTTPRTCSYPGCDKPVINWRWQCCTRSHQYQYSALKRHNKAV